LIRRLMRLLVALSVRGFFEAGWESFRRGHPAPKLLFAAASLLLVYRLGAAGAAAVEAAAAALMAASGELYWAASLEALLLIPAAWASLTSLALGAAGLHPISAAEALAIMLRWHAAGLAIAYPAATINPVDVYNAASRLAGPEKAAAVLTAYRLLPHGLTCFREALEASSTKKGAPLHAAVAAATAAVLEEAAGVVEATALRAKRPQVPVERSSKWTAAEAAATLILLLLLVLGGARPCP